MAASSSIGQRFTQLIQQLGLSKNAFAMSLDKTATVIQHLVDERNKPGYDLICKVFEIYPNVSKDWLLLGQGPMLLTEEGQASANAVPVASAPVVTPILLAPALSAPPAASQLPAEALVPAAAPSVPVAPAISPSLPAAAVQLEPTVPATPLPGAVGAAVPAAATEAAYLTAALHTQYLQHQLALAEQRNQHLLEQQQLMQQMLSLLQKNTG